MCSLRRVAEAMNAMVPPHTSSNRVITRDNKISVTFILGAWHETKVIDADTGEEVGNVHLVTIQAKADGGFPIARVHCLERDAGGMFAVERNGETGNLGFKGFVRVFEYAPAQPPFTATFGATPEWHPVYDSKMSDDVLTEIMAEYDAGYEKAYKHIPDLVAEIRRVRGITKGDAG